MICGDIGDNFIILMDVDQLLYSSGSNSKGQLGYSSSVEEFKFGCIDKIHQFPVKLVCCGMDFVMALGGIKLTDPNKLL